ncbi:hypothetical protein IAU59_002993 [Kwoniella sp. CBS 9459]
MGALGNVSGSNLIGVGIACGGNVLISLALTLQKLAHRRNEEAVRNQSQQNSDAESDIDHETGNIDEEPNHRSQDVSGGHVIRSESAPRLGRYHAAVHGTTSPIPEEDTPTPCPSPRPHPQHRQSSNEPSSSLSDPGRYPYIGMDGSIQIDGWISADSPGSQADGVQIKAVPVMVVPPSTETDQASIQSPETKAQSSHVRLDSPPHTWPNNGDRYLDNRHSNGNSSGGRDGDSNSNDKGDGHGQGEVQEGMYLKSKLWWAGMVLISIGEGGNFLSYGFAPASVVAPLGTVALIANCIFAPLILRERFHKKELVGMALAILGAVTVVWSSNGSNPRLNPSQLITAIKRLPFVIYTILNILLLIPLIFLSNSHWGHTYLFVDLGITCLFGGYTVLSTKALSSLLSNDFIGAWEDPITWFLVLVVAGTSVGQIRWLNRALMRFQSKEVIPTQFVLFSLSAIIGSAVLFQEFRDVPFSRFVNFAFGICTTFLGVHLLTSTPSENDSEDSASASASASDDGESHTTARRAQSQSQPRPQRASSSASLNLLIPTSNERAPLLVPQGQARMALPIYLAQTEGQPQRMTQPSHGDEGGASSGAYGTLSSPSSATPAATVASITPTGRIKLSKRTSTGEFTPTLGLGSQAGLLLMATTPPNPHLYMAGRGRSASRTSTNAGTGGNANPHSISQRLEEGETEPGTRTPGKNPRSADRHRSRSRSRSRDGDATQAL